MISSAVSGGTGNRSGTGGCSSFSRASRKFTDLISPARAFSPMRSKATFRRYGRGRHNAGLNFGDCCAYALAKDESAPLLFKGDDFSETDVAIAAY